MHNVYLFQPQFPVRMKNTVNYWLPYSAGCLWSYALMDPIVEKNFKLRDLYFRRDAYDLVLDSMQDPTVAGFSCYLWNENYCLKIAQLIKNKWPQCRIVFGGPQAGSDMLQHAFIDSIVMGEGEEAFVNILHSVVTGKTAEKFYPKARLSDLEIPSPYTLGLFDGIIQRSPDLRWATTIETNRGCPYACTFCDWGGTTYSKVKKFSMERVEQELDWISRHRVEYLFVADANFGIFKQRDLDIVKLIRHYADRDASSIEAVNLQYSKNNVDWVFEIGKELGPYNRGITVSVQSMNPDTLEAIKRINLESNDIEHITRLGENHGVATYTEIILGLPLETLDTWKNGISRILELGQHQSIMISFLELLKNSELSQFNSRLHYKLRSVMAEQSYEDDGTDREVIEIVNQTSTMTQAELVEAYVYGWVVLHCHISGYSQLLSRYAHKFHGVSYRAFYDEFYEKIINHDSFCDFCSNFQQSLDHYLTHGKFVFDNDGSKSFQMLYFRGHEFFYDRRDDIFDLGSTVLDALVPHDNTEIKRLQRMFLWDRGFPYPMTVESDIDIKSWKIAKTRYVVTNPLYQSEEIDFYATRYKNLLKNNFDIMPADE